MAKISCPIRRHHRGKELLRGVLGNLLGGVVVALKGAEETKSRLKRLLMQGALCAQFSLMRAERPLRSPQ